MDFKLILKKLNHTLTDSENIIFTKWYNESETHKAYFKNVAENYPSTLESTDIEKAWNIIEQKIEGSPKRNPYWNYGIAASISLLIALSYFFFNRDSTTISDPIIVEEAIHIGTTKATLTLQDGSTIDLGKGEIFTSGYLESNGEELIYNSNIEPVKSGKEYNYLTVPLGGQFIVTLSDNTKIWLNSGSKIKYPVAFKKGEVRRVELIYGEAYFDVSPSTNNKGSLFKVFTKGQTIEVLGTEFNVKAYKDEAQIYTTLIEGKVAINNTVSRETLLPNEQSIFNIEDNRLDKIKYKDADRLTAWKEGTFIFDKQPLSEIMKTLSRWYNTSVKFEDSKKQNIAFSGVLNKSEDIMDLLNFFQKTEEVSFKIINRTIIIN